jgi:hypothetical protein
VGSGVVMGRLQMVASLGVVTVGTVVAEIMKQEYAAWSAALARTLVRLAGWIHPPRRDEWIADVAFLQSGDACERANGLWEAGHHLLAAPKLQIVTISGAYWRVRRDPTVRLGGWLLIAGIGTTVAANRTRALRLPAADAELVLGVFLCVTGFYLVSLRDRLRDRKTIETPVHRALFTIALAGVCWSAGWTFVRTGSTDAGQGLAKTSWWGTNLGAAFAAVAALVGLVSVCAVHRRTMRDRKRRLTPVAVDAEQGQDEIKTGTEAITRLRLKVTCLAAKTTGAACMAFAVGKGALAMTQPAGPVRTSLLVTAAALCLAASNCGFKPQRYLRFLLRAT